MHDRLLLLEGPFMTVSPMRWGLRNGCDELKDLKRSLVGLLEVIVNLNTVHNYETIHNR